MLQITQCPHGTDTRVHACLICAETAAAALQQSMESQRQRDADRAQWRRYAEAALTGLLANDDDSSFADTVQTATAYGDAMLAADKAKWEGSHE